MGWRPHDWVGAGRATTHDHPNRRRARRLRLCGGGGAGPESADQSQQGYGIAAADVDRVLEAQDAINTACGLTRDEEGSDIPLPEAIKTLQGIYRGDPEGVFQAGVSTRPRNMRKVLQDNAATLRSCGKTAEATELASVVKSS